MTDERQEAIAAAAAEEFLAYWRQNYHDGVVISNAAWHAEKFARAVKRAVRNAINSTEVSDAHA